jgi:glycosyltransferase involved in cell wall biosynthesis
MTALTVTVEQRYLRTPDGSIWGPQLGYSFWCRYLEVFNRVHVVARVLDAPTVSDQWVRAEGDGVSFACIPHYVGPWEYLSRRQEVKQAVLAAIEQRNALIMRLDSQLAALVYPALRLSDRPYGVEVVTDPYDVFSPGSRHVFRPFFRLKFMLQLKQQCAGACAAAYVTSRALQQRYPPAPNAFSTWYSSVELTEERFASAPKTVFGSDRGFNLVTIGSMEDYRKAQDILLNAIAICVKSGLDVRLAVVGTGRLQKALENKAAELKLASRVTFLGHLLPELVLEVLDRSDLFVLASRGEGLPRAILEAMARGLPAIGSCVGGFPEVLPESELVPPGDARALARKIQATLHDPKQMAYMARRNLSKAREYCQDALRGRRAEFYQYVKHRTEVWLSRV